MGGFSPSSLHVKSCSGVGDKLCRNGWGWRSQGNQASTAHICSPASALHVLPSLFNVHCDYRVAQHPWRTLLLTEPEPEPLDDYICDISRFGNASVITFDAFLYLVKCTIFDGHRGYSLRQPRVS